MEKIIHVTTAQSEGFTVTVNVMLTKLSRLSEKNPEKRESRSH